MMTYTPTKYMDRTHPDAFVDWPKRLPAHGMTVECPMCKGHGGWNLALNQYNLPPGYSDISENRHQFSHFRQSCGNCMGWGYVSPEQAAKCNGHVWKPFQNLGRCYTRYRCIHCNQTADFDSSD
jgi:hypothetical protein